MRPSVYECLAGCLTGCVLFSGCNHERPRPAVYTYARPVVMAPATPVAPPANLANLPATPLEQKPVVKQETPPAESAVQQVKFPMGEDDPVKRRSFADITAKPCYAHDNDYRWLQGELQFVHARNCWRLRYASVDEEDKYGGSVTLTEMGSMDAYSNGQFVRVEGSMCNPECKDPSPAFRVTSMQALATPMGQP